MTTQMKYSADRVDRCLAALRLGATHRIAAQCAGIGVSTMREWLRDKPLFADAVREAESYGAVVMLERIVAAANEGTWQAAAWLLERRYPDMYGRFPENARRAATDDATGGDVRIIIDISDDAAVSTRSISDTAESIAIDVDGDVDDTISAAIDAAPEVAIVSPKRPLRAIR